MILKLPNLGDEATFTVKACERVEGNFGPQIRFTAANGDQLFLPADTAEQRIRFAFSLPSDEECDLNICVGNTLRFYREPNKTKGAKPYWAMEIAANAQPQPESKRVASPYREAGQRGPTTVPGGPENPHVSDLPEPPHGGLPPDWSDVPPPELEGEELPNEAAYKALARRVAAFQAQLGKEFEMPFDGSSVNAMSFSIWNTRR